MTKRTRNILTWVFFIVNIGIAIIVLEKRSNFTFVAIVILFSFSKDSIWFLYIPVFVNQQWNFLEPFVKQKLDKSKKGTVGNTGKKTPTKPKPKEIKKVVLRAFSPFPEGTVTVNMYEIFLLYY